MLTTPGARSQVCLQSLLGFPGFLLKTTKQRRVLTVSRNHELAVALSRCRPATLLCCSARYHTLVRLLALFHPHPAALLGLFTLPVLCLLPALFDLCCLHFLRCLQKLGGVQTYNRSEIKTNDPCLASEIRNHTLAREKGPIHWAAPSSPAQSPTFTEPQEQNKPKQPDGLGNCPRLLRLRLFSWGASVTGHRPPVAGTSGPRAQGRRCLRRDAAAAEEQRPEAKKAARRSRRSWVPLFFCLIFVVW